MAPEVARGRPYDCKCDVFSFAILFWEIASLKPAFKGFTRYMYFDRVVQEGERLPLPKKLNPLTKLMAIEAWDPNPEKRPDMRRVAALIRGDLNEMSNGDETVLHRTKHMMNRSHHSFRLHRNHSIRSLEQREQTTSQHRRIAL